MEPLSILKLRAKQSEAFTLGDWDTIHRYQDLIRLEWQRLQGRAARRAKVAQQRRDRRYLFSA